MRNIVSAVLLADHSKGKPTVTLSFGLIVYHTHPSLRFKVTSHQWVLARPVLLYMELLCILTLFL